MLFWDWLEFLCIVHLKPVLKSLQILFTHERSTENYQNILLSLKVDWLYYILCILIFALYLLAGNSEEGFDETVNNGKKKKKKLKKLLFTSGHMFHNKH